MPQYRANERTRSPISVDRRERGAKEQILNYPPHSLFFSHPRQDGFSRQEAQRAAQIPGQGKEGVDYYAIRIKY